MIVEWFIAVLATVVGWLASLFPSVPVPGWLTDGGSQWHDLLVQVASLNSWFPVGLAVTIAGVVLGSFGVGLVIKVVRIVASFATAGGGSAG